MRKTIKTIIETQLDSLNEILEYEDEIVGILKSKGYSGYGRNGCIMAINEFCLTHHIIINERIEYDDILRAIWWI